METTSLPTKRIVGSDDVILVTGATGFIGPNVVESLFEAGFFNVRCLARVSSNLTRLNALKKQYANKARLEIITGNLLSRDDCARAAKDATLIFHLATGSTDRSIPHSFLNTVVATRNLLDAAIAGGTLKRFVNMSSFVVYTNRDKPRGRVLDETCPLEDQPARREEAYTYAKVKQEELVLEYHKKHGLPFVTLRPGVVYGPGKNALTGRVGIGTFGLFLHLGGNSTIPLTYVKNCSNAIVLAGITPGIDGEAFNVIDDNLPSSRALLRSYKRNVKRFRSLYLPHFVSYLFCWLWEKHSLNVHGQLPPGFNRWMWHVYWKRSAYTNEKLKRMVGWTPSIPTPTGLERYFAACRSANNHA